MLKLYQTSKASARKIAIRQAGLANKAGMGRGEKGVLNCIQQLGYVQIDTISVVNRAHHHTLWNRVPNYKPDFLLHLQTKKRKIIEYWSHAAAYLPVEDYRYTLIRKLYFKDQKDPWPKSDPKLKKEVYQRIVDEGPLMARDFEHRKTTGTGWWDWKPAKLALERLFLEGDLMISHRIGFQKVYDLPERIIPDGIDVSRPSMEDYAQHLIERYLNLFGIASSREIAYLRNGMTKQINQQLTHMHENNDVFPIKVKGIEQNKYYIFPDTLKTNRIRLSKTIRFLSPFDNLLIQRRRTKELFDFDYQIECYVPKARREYGYFSLPILYGDKLIGRMDAKAFRKEKVLIINNLVFEEGVIFNQQLVQQFQFALIKFIKFNDCDRCEVSQFNPMESKILFQ